jgi:hypothetical protein
MGAIESRKFTVIFRWPRLPPRSQSFSGLGFGFESIIKSGFVEFHRALRQSLRKAIIGLTVHGSVFLCPMV